MKLQKRKPKKYSKTKILIPVIIVSVVIGSIVIFPTTEEGKALTAYSKYKPPGNAISGPFSINTMDIGIDDVLFFRGNEIPLVAKGYIIFKRPDGKIDHKIPFDGAKSAINHYFTPARSDDVMNCVNCNYFGTWTIQFDDITGKQFRNLVFVVKDKSKSQ